MDRGTSLAHVQKVVSIDDRVLRNYWVTQTYGDLSLAVSRVLDRSTANWCTFATWASFTVGSNMRGEDLPRWLRTRIARDDGMLGVVEKINAARHKGLAHVVDELTPDHLLDVARELFGACATNLSDGNTAVFAEIAPVAAMFVECFAAPPADHDASRDRVLTACDGALEFEGQNRLREGFALWCDAVREIDVVRKSQLILAGSLQLGAHEQNHLQEAIAGSIDMGMNTSLPALVARVKCVGDLGDLQHDAEQLLHPAVEALGGLWGDLMTDRLGTIQSPDGTLRLNADVPPIPGQPFMPPDLAPVVVDELATLLRRFNRSSGNGVRSRAADWIVLDERMNFIANLFCSRHHRTELFGAPFAPDIVARIEAEQIPRPPLVGAGREGSRRRPAPTVGVARFTDDFLEGLRAEGDPAGDAAVATYFAETGRDHPELFRALVRARTVPDSDDDAPGVHEFLTTVEPWPEWADPELVADGQRVFGDWGPQLGMALWMASLPADYACARGAVPLVRTALLTGQAKRRYVETGQMIIEAMTPGALAAGAKGYGTVRHVRLMHAAVRHVLVHAHEIADARTKGIGAWDAEMGVPINQEELLGCLLSFSVVGIQSLDRSGIRLSARDREAYIHAWNVVGHQIGIRADLLPLDYGDACELWQRLKRYEYADSDAGRELTRAAILCMQELIGLPILRGLPASGVRHYLGDETADLLGVPTSNWTRHFFTFVAMTDRFYDLTADVVPGRGWLTAELGRRMLRGFEAAERGGERPSFAISVELKRAWGMDVHPLAVPQRALRGVKSTSSALARRLPLPRSVGSQSPDG